jgi:hypothetical protein
MWYRYGTLQEVVQRVVLNMLIYTELLCTSCRHGGARRSWEGAGYWGGAGHRDVVVWIASCGGAGHRGWARKCECGVEVVNSKEFCIFVGYITRIVYKF